MKLMVLLRKHVRTKGNQGLTGSELCSLMCASSTLCVRKLSMNASVSSAHSVEHPVGSSSEWGVQTCRRRCWMLTQHCLWCKEL